MSSSVTPPTSFSFRCLQQSQITWTLTSATSAPISGLTVTSTLYVNENRSKPALVPGSVADANFSNLAMPETPSGSGIYIGVVPQAFNPSPSSYGFVVIITAYNGSTLLDTWTIPAVVVPPQGTNDLVQLDDVKTWLGIALNNTNDDYSLQLLISSFSQYVINRTGRNSFTQVNSYTDIYDGNGSYRMALRNYPIQTVTSVQVGAYQVPQSTSLITPGWFIEQPPKTIAIRNGGGAYMRAPYSIFPQEFSRGVGNVQIEYTAGYTSVPYDLYECAMACCAINYDRREWRDLASRAQSAGGSTGTTHYRSWSRPPNFEEILRLHTRLSLV